MCLSSPSSFLFYSLLSYYPSLYVLPLQLWAMHVLQCQSWWQVYLSCRGSLTLWWNRLCLGKFCKCRPCRVSSSALNTSSSVLLRHSSLLHVSSSIRTSISYPWMLTHYHIPSLSFTGSLISFQLIPSHIRGISLHFLTLFYGGGCFLGAFLIQLVHLLSGGRVY